MPIKKRLTEAQRLKRQLPKGWRNALRHPLLAKICYRNELFNPTPANIVKAINQTKGWKGATWAEKVFVQALDLIMEKAYGVGILDVDAYNRLQDHLIGNDNKMQAYDWRIWHTWLWDIYHDHYKLQDMEAGDLELPEPPKPVLKLKRKVVPKPTPKAKPKRRKVIKPK